MLAANQIPGPYWLAEAGAELRVMGRHGKIIRRYPITARTCADEDVRRLQVGYTTQQKRINAAAHDLLEAAQFALAYLQDHAAEKHDDADYAASVDLAVDMISKAVTKAVEGRCHAPR